MIPRVGAAPRALPAAQPVPVYCINLPRSAGRRRSMENEFARLAWRAQFVRAVDGARQVDAASLLRHGALAGDNEGVDGPLSPAEIGCYLSHERAWRAIRAGGYDRAIVCEDDVRFRRPVFPLADLLFGLPADCDVLYLHYLDSVPAIISPPFDRDVSAPVARAGHYGIHRAWACGGAQCYLVTASGARKLCAAARPLRFPVDGLMGRLAYEQRIVVYVVSPRPTETGLHPSTML